MFNSATEPPQAVAVKAIRHASKTPSRFFANFSFTIHSLRFFTNITIGPSTQDNKGILQPVQLLNE
jgi:hypothetical protein